jgi:hypothetical protein
VEWWTVLGADPPYQVEAGFEAAATRHYGLLATTRRYCAPIATVPSSVSLVDLVDERIELPHQLESSERNSNHDCLNAARTPFDRLCSDEDRQRSGVAVRRTSGPMRTTSSSWKRLASAMLGAPGPASAGLPPPPIRTGAM